MDWRRGISVVVFFAIMIGVCWSSSRNSLATTSTSIDSRQLVDFTRDIQPILADKCYACHGPDGHQRKAELRLDSIDGKESPFVPRDGYSIITPGNVNDSVMVMRITSDDPDTHMPPPQSKRTPTPAQIELLTRWVQQGAKWGKHWSLVAPKRPALPQVQAMQWTRNPIDRFILARLEKEGLQPSPEASKETLIRRVTLDLTGLPPTTQEVDAFIADAAADAYEKVVDRLLASPRYGERMVWEWLDTARYADTNGYQADNTRTMWPWRDWAISAFNDNMPFDQFTIQQVAGDLLPAPTTQQRIATGFLRNHPINGEGGRIPEENRAEYVMEMAETVGTTWLGLTVGCARCHDHKFDPITQKDFYSLSAFFNQTPVTGGDFSGQVKPVVDFATPEQIKTSEQLGADVKQRASVVEEMEKIIFPRPSSQPARASTQAAGLSGNISAALGQRPQDRYLPFVNEMAIFYKEKKPQYSAALDRLKIAVDARDHFNATIPRVMVMEDQPTTRETFVLIKGSYDKHGDKVSIRTPTTLPALPEGKADRLALAKWLVSSENPLTARVTVNRFWQQFLGVGIVKTAEDFGVQGERPTHPELLDWLAVEFRESGWDVKAMVRLIVSSASYRQSSNMTAEQFERDPENRFLARGPRYRLPAFVIRDQALAASGLLVDKIGGPPVKGYQPPGVWEEATFGQIKYQQDHGDALWRRSVYTFWRRIVGPTDFFDTASRVNCTVRTTRTNTPVQVFVTLNNVTHVEAARALAERVMREAGTAEKRLDLAYRLVLARHPGAGETDVWLRGLERLKKEYSTDKPAATKLVTVGESKRDDKFDPTEHAAYTGVCLGILNLDEALTKE